MNPNSVAMITFPHSSWFSSTGIPRQATRHTPRFSAPTQFGVLLRRKRSEGSNGSMNLTKLWCQMTMMTPIRPTGSGYHGDSLSCSRFSKLVNPNNLVNLLLTHWVTSGKSCPHRYGASYLSLQEVRTSWTSSMAAGPVCWSFWSFGAMNRYMGVVSG